MRRILALTVCVAVALTSAFSVYATKTVKKETGWNTVSNNLVKYIYPNGLYAVGLKNIDGKTYFFNSEGILCTGIQTVKNKKYYFDPYMKTGLQTIESRKYFFSPYMKTGIQTVKNKKYYFGPYMKTGIQTVKNKKYYFGPYMKTGTQTIQNNTYYFDPSGEMHRGWLKMNGFYYLYDKNGKLVPARTKIASSETVFNCKTQSLPQCYYSDGDNIAFIGDSITHYERYIKRLQSFFYTRYPWNKLTVYNCGVGGTTTNYALTNINDILLTDSNKCVIMFGMNDMMFRSSFFVSSDVINRRYNSYKKNYYRLVSTLAKNGYTDMVLMSPSIFDDTSTMNALPLQRIDYNSNLMWLGDNVVSPCANYFGYTYVNLNRQMLAVNKKYQQQNSSNTIISQDRIHPEGLGAWVMAYYFLKATSTPCVVADTEIDSKTKNVNKLVNSEISDLRISNSGVSFLYSPGSLPMPAVGKYAEADALVPITQDYNREIIRITGLEKNSRYVLKINAATLMTVTGEELARGVNIAINPKYINQQKSIKLMSSLPNQDYIFPDRCRYISDYIYSIKNIPYHNMTVLVKKV